MAKVVGGSGYQMKVKCDKGEVEVSLLAGTEKEVCRHRYRFFSIFRTTSLCAQDLFFTLEPQLCWHYSSPYDALKRFRLRRTSRTSLHDDILHNGNGHVT